MFLTFCCKYQNVSSSVPGGLCVSILADWSLTQHFEVCRLVMLMSLAVLVHVWRIHPVSLAEERLLLTHLRLPSCGRLSSEASPVAPSSGNWWSWCVLRILLGFVVFPGPRYFWLLASWASAGCSPSTSPDLITRPRWWGLYQNSWHTLTGN